MVTMDMSSDRNSFLCGTLQNVHVLPSIREKGNDEGCEESTPEDAAGPVDVVTDTADHSGLLGYGTSTIFDFWSQVSSLAKRAAKIPGARLIPGLNLIVTVLEGHNAYKSYKDMNKPVASCRMGNSLACLGNFVENVGLGYVAAGKVGKFLGLAGTLWALSGCMALVGGIGEIRDGLGMGKENSEKEKDKALVSIGAMDVLSGVTTVAGSALLALGVWTPAAIGLYAASCACDILSISTYYYSMFSKGKADNTSECRN
jgi:hypothetical protein